MRWVVLGGSFLNCVRSSHGAVLLFKSGLPDGLFSNQKSQFG
jgi:hypothetical protein